MAIRELAVLLRNALAAKTQDAHKEVYCWQVRTVWDLAQEATSGTWPTWPIILAASNCNTPIRSIDVSMRMNLLPCAS